jgi:hypothetical protein
MVWRQDVTAIKPIEKAAFQSKNPRVELMGKLPDRELIL